MRILVVEDEKRLADTLCELLAYHRYTADAAYDGETGLDNALSGIYDAVILDVMMPKKDGFEVCRNIREESNVPVILITARGEDFERIMGLDIGADDYIVKPFSPNEVMARVRAVLRHRSVFLFSYGSVLCEKIHTHPFKKTAFYPEATGLSQYCIPWHEQLPESGGDYVCSDRYEQFYDLLWGKNDIWK